MNTPLTATISLTEIELSTISSACEVAFQNGVPPHAQAMVEKIWAALDKIVSEKSSRADLIESLTDEEIEIIRNRRAGTVTVLVAK